MTFLDAFVLGVVEGLSEFLPISSTGHLILASALMKLQQTDGHKVFEVTIQLGAMLAVLFIYCKRLVANPELLKKLAVAFLPTGTIGFLLYKLVKSLFVPSLVSYMLILGGVAFILIEWFLKRHPASVEEVQNISYGQAFLIGLVQCLSMVPGVSRSGATIMGGLLCGLSRTAAAEFSFLLALPTMLAATAYDIYKNHAVFQASDLQNIAVGFVTSFIFAVISIKWLLRFVTSHTFVSFGIYRIAVGVLFLLFLF
ncbi:undecaprenyl-diphosphate phosphatase [Trichlorobacter ammonificans]|uniref:Undecaprenyl-diphosphatase n=1 Tax=Trichlorobacter ammonificans TaxID=2916410 RepID=A0ABM9DBP4_9BACT|nr:undecaprenyl-diphosphate phosphatase [Trichlorobacter ammonificans]CAH2031818.1 Undecaprenyl-diphosphatase [Trichlorobacter ammonificans]